MEEKETHVESQGHSIEGMAKRDIHRIGGGGIDNLRLKPKEAALEQPGISVLKAASPTEAAQQIRSAFPKAQALHKAAGTVGSTHEELIRVAGFDVVPFPSATLPNHHRIVHADGAAGFHDDNLAKLAEVFQNTSGH